MTKSLRALVVDDEEGVRFFLIETLQRMGHVVTEASSGEEALDHLRDTAFDLAILDLKLGGPADGQRVLESIRWRWPATMVIMLTAHGSLESAVEAIHEGVDGYLLKPVRPIDVRRAVQKALHRRQKLIVAEPEPLDHRLQRGPFHIDLERYEAKFEGQILSLSPRDFALLHYLMQKAPQVVSAAELVKVIRQYEPEYAGEARTMIKWYVHQLRKKVEPNPAKPRYILNVRGVGYRFVG
ncbi:MAG TPA: response regulator transcription factor [Anaerolineales bacterium]|nr:response regulator transcription factor [Anaerolineales bacterium]